MASRRSRKMQQGGGDVQDRLATLAAMKQLMGNPMQDLGGLLGLQSAMQDMEQQRLNEQRSSRQEDFAQRQLDQRELQRRQDFNQQDFANRQAAKDSAARREEAARGYELGQRQVAVGEERNRQASEASQREEATGFSPELHKLLIGVDAISRSQMISPSLGQAIFDGLSRETGFELGEFQALGMNLPGAEGGLRPNPNAPDPSDREATIEFLKKGREGRERATQSGY